MAAPIGHIICALAFINNNALTITKKNEFFAGTSFPDIRYIENTIDRKTTHTLKEKTLGYVLKAPSDFERGRRLHVLIDYEREKYMRKHNAYRFVPHNNYRTQILKAVEDKILLENFKKTNFNAERVFNQIYPEEQVYNIKNNILATWHTILATYLDTNNISIVRYYKSLRVYYDNFGMPKRLFKNFLTSMKTIAFLFYTYVQIEWLSHDRILKELVLDFYEKEVPQMLLQQKNKS